MEAIALLVTTPTRAKEIEKKTKKEGTNGSPFRNLK
jgi:hypothetical protein